MFVVRDKRGQPRAVTLGAITRYLPELRPSRVEQLASAVKSHLTELRLQLRRDAQEAAEGAVAGRLQELRERDAKISAEVELLSKVLADFAGERRRP